MEVGISDENVNQIAVSYVPYVARFDVQSRRVSHRLYELHLAQNPMHGVSIRHYYIDSRSMRLLLRNSNP